MSFYNFAKSVVGGFFGLFYRVSVEGLENVPKEGGFVVCANHKSVLDPPLLGVCIPAEFKFMAKEELFKNKLLGSMLRALGAFPVKRGKSDLGALKAALKMTKEGGRLVIFPEGTRSDKNSLKPGKGGAVLIAVKAGVDILPVGICGRYRPFSKIVIKIGKPISLDEYYGKKPDSQTVQYITDEMVMKEISRLSGVPVYQGITDGGKDKED